MPTPTGTENKEDFLQRCYRLPVLTLKRIISGEPVKRAEVLRIDFQCKFNLPHRILKYPFGLINFRNCTAYGSRVRIKTEHFPENFFSFFPVLQTQMDERGIQKYTQSNGLV